jgi:hypothetical protein
MRFETVQRRAENLLSTKIGQKERNRRRRVVMGYTEQL